VARLQPSIGLVNSSGSRIAETLSRNYDLALALFVAAVVALFVLPLPTAALDAMIATNLALSIILLTVSIYISSPLNLSTFPSMLLFTTLLRLSLNIASCKLILLNANAGHVIDTFGKLVVGNNVVVGGVVFLTIAIVQFIVIAKGAERVAEVGARFTLDAMPGKQMSIDADLRAGIISSEEAKQRRQQLEEECQLHGSMDGAMKFVKGDAIAGIIIALINILAGIAVGTLMHDMSVSEALRRYAILTVGDGMASQIPSLLVSIAAGVVITRVASREGVDKHLGAQMGRQVLAHPRALLIAALVLSAFLLVPGFPKWAFGMLAAVIGAGSVVLMRRRKAPSVLNLMTVTGSRGDEMGSLVPPRNEGVAALLSVRIAEDFRPHLDVMPLHTALLRAKEAVEADIGPIFPRLNLVFDHRLALGTYQILVQDMLMATGHLRAEHLLLNSRAERPEQIEGQPGEPFGPFRQVVWVDARHAREHLARDAVLDNETVLARHIESVVREHAASMLGIQETQNLVHLVQREMPELTAELMRLVPLQRIAEVLERLLLENIPIRNLRGIFESLITWGPKEQDIVALVESVRVDMKRFITGRYCGSARRLDVILFEQGMEDQVNSSVQRTPRGNFLGLSPDAVQDIREQVKKLVALAEKSRAVVVVSMDIRRYVKNLVEPVAPHLPVLSYQEIEGDVSLQPIGWVTGKAEAR
jgi:type III secretion protein V